MPHEISSGLGEVFERIGRELRLEEGPMAMRPFKYYRPSTVREACRILAEEERPFPLAGGTDLLVHIQRRQKRPTAVVNLKRIPDLAGIEANDRWVRIGSLASLAALMRSPVILGEFPVLPYTARFMGSPAIRNMATVGGNCCNASPAADLPPVFLALDAEVVIAGLNGERRMPLTEFFRGPGKTALGRGEILTEVCIPLRRGDWRISYERLDVRHAMDIAIAGAAMALRMEDGRCAEARVALCAVAPTPIRVPGAEEALVGRPLEDEAMDTAIAASMDATLPISDIRATAEYRREMVGMLVRRGLVGILQKAGGR